MIQCCLEHDSSRCSELAAETALKVDSANRHIRATIRQTYEISSRDLPDIICSLTSGCIVGYSTKFVLHQHQVKYLHTYLIGTAYLFVHGVRYSKLKFSDTHTYRFYTCRHRQMSKTAEAVAVLGLSTVADLEIVGGSGVLYQTILAAILHINYKTLICIMHIKCDSLSFVQSSFVIIIILC